MAQVMTQWCMRQCIQSVVLNIEHKICHLGDKNFTRCQILFHIIGHKCRYWQLSLEWTGSVCGCAVSVIQKQLACILGRQQVFFELADDYSELMDLMRNSSLNTHFINLAREVCL